MSGILSTPEAMQKLKDDLTVTLEHLDRQIDEVYHYASSQDIPVHQVRLPDGQWVLGPLLIAKAQTLAAIVALTTQQRASQYNMQIMSPPYPPR